MGNIKGVDIVEKDHLGEAIISGEELLKVYKKLDAQILKTAKDSKKMAGALDVKSAKGIQQLNVALSESEKKKKAIIKVDKDRAALEVKLKTLNSEKIKQNDILKRQISDQTKANKEWAEGQRKLVGTEERLLAANKKLRAERKKLDTTTKQGTARLNKINDALNKNNALLIKNSDNLKKQKLNVGNYSSALKGATGGLKRFAGALGLVGGMALLVKGLKAAFNVIKNFDQATANLSSVLGVSKEAMSALTEQAKSLGSSTKFTAAQVSELQLEFAKLGFVQRDIEQMTESTLQLAAAAGTDLGNAAAITGATMRGFGLETSETQRVVDVMAKSFSSSSLDITKFASAMSAVAPVANAAGVNLERTTSLLGTLTDRGIDASSAGTGLRNMFLSATQAGISFDEALAQVNGASDKTAKSLQLFGKKGATLGVILAENGASVDALESKLNSAGGAAKEMADKQLDTLGGALDILQSAWEGIILEMNEGTGAGEGFKEMILLVAKALPVVVRAISELVKVSVASVKVIFDMIAAWSEAFESTDKLKKALLATAKAVIKSTSIFARLGDSLMWVAKQLGFADELTQAWADTLEFLGLTEFAEDLGLVTKKTKELTQEQRRANVVNEQSIKIGKELLSQNQEEISDIAILIDGLTDENVTREQKNEIMAKLQEDYPDVIANIDLETASTEALVQVKKDLIKTLIDEAINRKALEAKEVILGQILDKQVKKIGKNKGGVAFLDKEISELTSGLLLIDEIAENVRANMGGVIDNLNLESAGNAVSDKITEFENQIKDLRNSVANATNAEDKARFQKLLDEKIIALKQFQKQHTDIINDGLDKEDALNGDSDDGPGGEGGDSDADKRKIDELNALKKANALELIELENHLKTIGEDEDVIRQTIFDKRKGQLRSEADFIIQLDFETNEQLILQRQDYLNFIEKGEIKRVDLHKKANHEVSSDDLLATKKQKKSQDENLKLFKEFSSAMVDAAKQLVDFRIAELDRLVEARKVDIEASKAEVSRLQTLAAAGNADAAESIKAEKIKQAKDKLEIKALEKKKKNLLMLVTTLNLANNLIQSGDSNGLKNASGKMEDFFSNLPKNFDGTEGTVAQAYGQTGTKDGHVVRVHDNEHIIGANDSDMLHKAGFSNTKDIVGSAIAFQNRKAVRGTVVDNASIVEGLKEVKKAISDKETVRLVQQHIDLSTGQEVIVDGNNIYRNNHRPNQIQL